MPSEAVSRSMRGNKSRDTKPELALRRELRRPQMVPMLGDTPFATFATRYEPRPSHRGYRVNYPIRVGPVTRIRADVVFVREKVAVFVDGCWWHGCPQHYRPPKSALLPDGTPDPEHYWIRKVATNALRDLAQTHVLENHAGWKVVRVWEHEPVGEQAAKVRGAVDHSRIAAHMARVFAEHPNPHYAPAI